MTEKAESIRKENEQFPMDSLMSVYRNREIHEPDDENRHDDFNEEDFGQEEEEQQQQTQQDISEEDVEINEQNEVEIERIIYYREIKRYNFQKIGELCNLTRIGVLSRYTKIFKEWNLLMSKKRAIERDILDYFEGPPPNSYRLYLYWYRISPPSIKKQEEKIYYKEKWEKERNTFNKKWYQLVTRFHRKINEFKESQEEIKNHPDIYEKLHLLSKLTFPNEFYYKGQKFVKPILLKFRKQRMMMIDDEVYYQDIFKPFIQELIYWRKSLARIPIWLNLHNSQTNKKKQKVVKNSKYQKSMFKFDDDGTCDF